MDSAVGVGCSVLFVTRAHGDGGADGGDHVRLLARRSELAYTDRPAAALDGEPEAVDAATQARLSERARRTAVEREARAWGEVRVVVVQLCTLLGATRWSGSHLNDARTLGRACERVVRRPYGG